jgi:hypothetical protein
MTFEVDSQFPTGNGAITASGRTLRLDRDLRDSTGDRWYWHIRLRARTAGAAVEVRTVRPALLGRFGPAVSVDDAAYEWMASGEHSDLGFTLGIPAGRTLRVCATLPYGLVELERFRRTGPPQLAWSVLTTSEWGRPVTMVRTGDSSCSRLVVLTARHHACEAVASYVLEGAATRLVDLHADSRYRDVALLAIPMMDVDGVAAGDQGKGRSPHDHNRDYGPTSRYASVRALRRLLESETRTIVGLDLHTPGLRGELEERPYVVASGDPSDVQLAEALASRIAATRTDLLIFDEPWNDATNPGPRCCAAWVRGLPRTRLAHTIEYPNAVDRDLPVTPERARAFGATLIGGALQATQ